MPSAMSDHPCRGCWCASSRCEHKHSSGSGRKCAHVGSFHAPGSFFFLVEPCVTSCHTLKVFSLCLTKVCGASLDWVWLKLLRVMRNLEVLLLALVVCLSVCQSVSLSVCQSVSLSVCQSVSLFLCLVFLSKTAVERAETIPASVPSNVRISENSTGRVVTMTMTHSEKSHIRRMKAWLYRQECRGHDPTKKNLFY